MSDILEEFLGNEMSVGELISKISNLEKRVSKLENKEYNDDVYIDGSPQIVKDYWQDLQEKKNKNKGGGS